MKNAKNIYESLLEGHVLVDIDDFECKALSDQGELQDLILLDKPTEEGEFFNSEKTTSTREEFRHPQNWFIFEGLSECGEYILYYDEEGKRSQVSRKKKGNSKYTVAKDWLKNIPESGINNYEMEAIDVFILREEIVDLKMRIAKTKHLSLQIVETALESIADEKNMQRLPKE